MERKENHRRRTAAAAPLAGAIAGLAGLALAPAPAAAGETVEREIPLAKSGEVSVENLAGSVTVKTWDRAMVRITGTLGEDVRELEVRTDEDGEELEIEVVLPRRSGNWSDHDSDADLELTVPVGAGVGIETVSATVDVSGVRGDVEIETVSGTIDLRAPESADVESVSGRIRIRDFRGDVAASTVSGGIDVTGGEGSLELSTVSGTVTVGKAKLRGLEMDTVSGSLRADFDPSGDGYYTFESVSGSIDLVLPAALDATLEVEVFSGRIRTEFDGDHDEAEYGPGAWFRGRYGKGSAEITVENHSGNVEIRKR